MNERITIRLSEEAKEQFSGRSTLVFSNVSDILRGFITFINTLPEVEARTFLTMIKNFKVREEAVTDFTLRG